MAEFLHLQGFDLVLHYFHSGPEAEALAQRLNGRRADSVHLVRADLSDPIAVRELANRALRSFGRLDALINNASQFFPTPIATATDQDWERLFHTNLRAPYILSQALSEALKAHQGCIINIADVYAHRPLKEHSLYNASKAALVSLTQSLAQELAPDIRVNAIAPGAILWPDQTGAEADSTNTVPASYQQAILQKVALGRLGTPEDIARAAWFLIAEAPYITGQILNVDGGRTLTI